MDKKPSSKVHLVQKNASLQHMHSFGMTVAADFLAILTSKNQLNDLQNNPLYQNNPHLILGGGSNVLFTRPFNGLVIKNSLKGIEIVRENDEHIWLKVGAGESWHAFVLFCVENQYAGIENLALIPGTMGAAPMQNIGAYGTEIKTVFSSLTAIDLSAGKEHQFNTNECEFGYRSSIFKTTLKNKMLICDVTLKLNKRIELNTSYAALDDYFTEHGINNLSLKKVCDAVIDIRQQKLPDPKKIGNAGSFFKNPYVSPNVFEKISSQHPNCPSFPGENHNLKIPAAWLIEQCGFKGKRFGDVGVHKLQPLVLVNYGNGTGSALKHLAEKIQQSVLEKFNILLEPEVNIY